MYRVRGGEFVSAPAVRACRAHRQNDEARLRGRIPDADLRVRRKRHAEISEHAARIVDRARAIRRRFVPDRRQAEHFPRIAGAQGAHDHVVEFGRVLDRNQVIAEAIDQAKRSRRLGRILDQSPLERRISPSFGDDLRADMRPDFRFIGFDHGVERRRIEIAFLRQHRL